MLASTAFILAGQESICLGPQSSDLETDFTDCPKWLWQSMLLVAPENLQYGRPGSKTRQRTACIQNVFIGWFAAHLESGAVSAASLGRSIPWKPCCPSCGLVEDRGAATHRIAICAWLEVWWLYSILGMSHPGSRNWGFCTGASSGVPSSPFLVRDEGGP